MRFVGRGESGAFLVRVDNEGIGNDIFDGYEISLSRDGKKVIMGKHMQDFKLLKEEEVTFDPESWSLLKVVLNGSEIVVWLNGKQVLSFEDKNAPLLTGRIGLRTWKSGLDFRNVVSGESEKAEPIKFELPESEQISYN